MHIEFREDCFNANSCVIEEHQVADDAGRILVGYQYPKDQHR